MVYANMILIMLVAGVLELAARILFTLAVESDCRAIGAKNRVGWAILTFFIPIAAIVYLFVRKNGVAKEVPKMCLSCGATNMQEAVVCANCGNAAFADFEVSDKEKHSKKAKKFLISGLVTWIAGIVICVVVLVVSMVGVAENYGDNFEKYFDDYMNDFGYSDDFNSDEFEDFGDFEFDEEFETQPSDDLDDFFN